MKRKLAMGAAGALFLLSLLFVAYRKGETPRILPQSVRTEALRENKAASDMAAAPVLVAKEAGEARPSSPPHRKMILSHNLLVETRRFDESFALLARMAEKAGGHNTEESRHKTADGTYRGRVSMRVPPGSAGGLLEAARKLGEVVSENSSGDDVTEAYYDLEARIRNAKSAESRMLDLLAKRTDKLSEVLEVEREVTRIRGEIESMESRKRGMDIRTATTAITVDLAEPARAVPVTRKVLNPLRTVFVESLTLLAISLRYILLALFVAAPWAAVIAAAVYLKRRVWRGARKEGKAT